MHQLFNGIYKNRKVFITGHTGFKGSWLLLWLQQLGAHVEGYSLAPATNPAHIHLLRLYEDSATGNIADIDKLRKRVTAFKPDIVFHLAAQPLVRRSYVDPLETFQTNIIGTANTLQAIRENPSVKAVVNVTTDKVYKNFERDRPYEENDVLGGHDPYSTSKACVELIHESFVKSFFREAGVLSATARAGNVIGGGDWAEDRLIPDVVKASMNGKPVEIRNPTSVRPWQHVLDPLSAYLLLGQLLLQKETGAEGSWNFGPEVNDCLSVESVLDRFHSHWDKLNWVDVSAHKNHHEAKLLRLDCTKAMRDLSWKPVWGIDIAIERTAVWYKSYYTKNVVRSLEDLDAYCDEAKNKKLSWAS